VPDAPPTTIHASAVLVGTRAVLIRGPSGSGKSRLVLSLLDAAAAGLFQFARLVADDRVLIDACHGRLLASPPNALAGLLEVRGLGLRRVAHETPALIGWVVDLAASGAERLPLQADRTTTIAGVTLPRIAIHACTDPAPVLVAALRTQEVAF
jgi:serine kinase of HPr protein (carbohydrate metabolism regulator)